MAGVSHERVLRFRVHHRWAVQRPRHRCNPSLCRSREARHDLCRVLECDRSDDGKQDDEQCDHWGLWNRPQRDRMSNFDDIKSVVCRLVFSEGLRV